MEEVNPTLGEIKAYCEEMGIELEPTIEHPTVVSNTQFYGDVYAEAYFTFYNQNKEAIDSWVTSRRNGEELSGMSR